MYTWRRADVLICSHGAPSGSVISRNGVGLGSRFDDRVVPTMVMLLEIAPASSCRAHGGGVTAVVVIAVS